MNIFLDLAVVIIVALSIYLAVKKGFMKTLMKLIGLVLTVAVMFFFASTLGKTINVKFLSPAVAEKICTAVEEDAEKLQDKKLLSKIIEKADINIASYGDTDTLKENISTKLNDNKLMNTLGLAVACIVILIAIWLVMWLLGLILKPIFKLPVLKQLHGILSFVLGVVNAAILLCIMGVVVTSASATYTPKTENGSFKTEVVDKTYIYKYVDEYNPIISIADKNL